jgi:hypothetical protein
MFPYALRDQVSHSYKANDTDSDLHAGVVRFEYRQRHGTSQITRYMTFLTHSGITRELGHDIFHSHLPTDHPPIILNLGRYNLR